MDYPCAKFVVILLSAVLVLSCGRTIIPQHLVQICQLLFEISWWQTDIQRDMGYHITPETSLAVVINMYFMFFSKFIIQFIMSLHSTRQYQACIDYNWILIEKAVAKSNSPYTLWRVTTVVSCISITNTIAKPQTNSVISTAAAVHAGGLQPSSVSDRSDGRHQFWSDQRILSPHTPHLPVGQTGSAASSRKMCF